MSNDSIIKITWIKDDILILILQFNCYNFILQGANIILFLESKEL